MESVITAPVARSVVDTALRARRVEWCLRVAAAGCFIGHGVFGIVTKQAWVPYFAIFGIGESTAYRLMPVVGTIDVLSGLVALFSPRPFALLYMTAWATMTALLRPMAGESPFETLERAGNFGVPLALLLFLGIPRRRDEWGDRFSASARRADVAIVGRVLQVTTALLLFGHGALEAIIRKPVFETHYAAIGLGPTVAPALGYLEMIGALMVLVAPTPALLIGIAVWKVVTEMLFPLSGAPIWEFVERAGSYGAPIALALFAGTTALTRITFRRTTT